jgi:hypothetical protein
MLLLMLLAALPEVLMEPLLLVVAAIPRIGDMTAPRELPPPLPTRLDLQQAELIAEAMREA